MTSPKWEKKKEAPPDRLFKVRKIPEQGLLEIRKNSALKTQALQRPDEFRKRLLMSSCSQVQKIINCKTAFLY